MEKLKVKDFIIDLDEIKKDNEKKNPAKRNKSSVDYSLKLENDMDFVVNRKSSKQDKDLVFLVSQELFYIKDNKTSEITKLNEHNASRNISSFIRDLNEPIVFQKVKWMKKLWDKEGMVEVIKNPNRVFIIQNNLESPNISKDSYTIDLIKKNKKLFNLIFSTFNSFSKNPMVDSIYYVCDKFNYNNAELFVKLLKQTNMNGYYLDSIVKFIETYNCDINTFLEYITIGFLRQGITSIDNSAFYTYQDYLKMKKEMYGKIKNKYPKALKTEHDIVARKYDYWFQYKDDLTCFDNNEKTKSWEYKNKKYCIVAPQCSADVLDEAIQQNNCVASYISRIAKGETHILFMRLTSSPEDSLVTIEVNKNNEVCQVYAYNNTLTSKEENKFIEQWAKDKGLTITYLRREN